MKCSDFLRRVILLRSLRNTNAAFVLVVAGALLGSGCATKKYVRNTVDPVSNKVDQVASQTNQQGQALDATKKDVAQNQQDISATRETAKAADARAGDALTAANLAGSKADQANHGLDELRNTVANLDDYKPATAVVVPFGFNRYLLTPDAKAQLDQLAQSKDQWKRYFIAVEGYTDRTGSESYNDVLSKRRADKVVQYLVSKYDIPVYRIHEIGMGKDKPADDGHGSAANAKNRRVEVTVYSADAAVASTIQPGVANQ
jgi:outer membrane protein OmpA-like peptidoglycan-associated protein